MPRDSSEDSTNDVSDVTDFAHDHKADSMLNASGRKPNERQFSKMSCAWPSYDAYRTN